MIRSCFFVSDPYNTPTGTHGRGSKSYVKSGFLCMSRAQKGLDKDMAHKHTMEGYSAVKRNDIVSLAEMWMDLETRTA